MFGVVVVSIPKVNAIETCRDIDRLFPFVGGLVQLVEQIVLFGLKENLFWFFLEMAKEIDVVWFVRGDQVNGCTFMFKWMARMAILVSGFSVSAARKARAPRNKPIFPRQIFATSARRLSTHIRAKFSQTLSLNKGMATMLDLHSDVSLTFWSFWSLWTRHPDLPMSNDNWSS